MSQIDMHCLSTDRRRRVRETRGLTGIDYVDYARGSTDDGAADGDIAAGRRGPTPILTVHLLGPLPTGTASPNFVIDGGRRVTGIRVVSVRATKEDEEGEATMALHLDREGDPSSYTLRLVNDRDVDPSLLDGVDPRYDRVSFSFRLDCPADIDCVDQPEVCATDATNQPALDYLAKDYGSFRQLLFERLSLTLPSWRETHAADVGVALVELMAYLGDQLSYRQDAIATEAYIDTARLRTSIRRHARLVDYRMHEGCNARTWVVVSIDQHVIWNAQDVAFYTRMPKLPAVVTLSAVAGSGEAHQVFLPIADQEAISLWPAHGRIPIYTWGGEECSLPRGATRATLVDAWVAPLSSGSSTNQKSGRPSTPPERARSLALKVGDILILEEVVGPHTGDVADADPSRRHAVRLTRVTQTVDPLPSVNKEGSNDGASTPLVEVEWMGEDALPFPLCLSSIDASKGCAPIHDVSVARGNVILVDHGRWTEDEPLPCVEPDDPPPLCEAPGRPAFQGRRAKRYRATLSEPYVTFRAPPAIPEGGTAGPGPRVWPPATALLRQDPRAALPVVELASSLCLDRGARCPACGSILRASPPPGSDARTLASTTTAGPAECPSCGGDVGALSWVPRYDLLDSSGDDAHFVLENDDFGYAHLRFGDGVNGRELQSESAFSARYRTGIGPAGNVGAEAIAHVSVVGGVSGLGVAVRNPLPAVGGTSPEPVEDVRSLAGNSLRSRRQRAVIADDYAEIALRDHGSLQRAAATLRWTGSWYEVLIALDPQGSEETPSSLRSSIERGLERYRRIGHDMRVVGAEYVPLFLEIAVCARPEYLRAHVRQAVLDTLLGRGAKPGFFHPDRCTFGQPVELAALVAAVQAVPGVLDVEVLRFERMFMGDRGELDAGEIDFGPQQIAQVDNDPARPENGIVKITMRGGR